jgi:hypothetical protein
MGHPKLIGRVTRCLAIAMATYGAADLAPCRATAQAVDSIISRVVTARGGVGRLHTVRSQRLTGHIVFSPTVGGTIVVEQRRPGMIREEIVTRGQTLVRAFNGASGWSRMPSEDSVTLHLLMGDDLRNIAAEADFDGALIDARVKGNRIEFVGRDTVAGAVAFKLKVILRSGYTDYWYVDSASALPSKWEGMRMVDGTPVVFESYFRDYLSVDGLRFARVIDTGLRGSPDRQQLVFDRVDINPLLDNTRFAVPNDTSAVGVIH